jgi:hypothetical protein
VRNFSRRAREGNFSLGEKNMGSQVQISSLSVYLLPSAGDHNKFISGQPPELARKLMTCESFFHVEFGAKKCVDSEKT